MVETLLGAAGAFLLYVFFRAVAARWPESYYGLSDFTSYELSLRLGSYVTFRFLPVVVTALLASVMANSLGQHGPLAGVAVGVIHGLATAGRSAFNAWRRSGVFGRRLLLASHFGVLIAVIIAGWAGGALGRVEALQNLVPTLEDMRSDLWTALLAGVFGAYLVRVTQRSEVTPEELVRASTRRVDSALFQLADDAAARYGADPVLVRAILLVENLQRPRWIRSVERLFGSVLPIGTYGVMQVRSDRPISDAESIELAASTKLAGLSVPISSFTSGGKVYTTVDGTSLRRIIRSYNGNERFIELVEEVYYVLRG